MADMNINTTNCGLTLTEKIIAEFTGEKPINGIDKGKGYPVIGYITEKRSNDQGEFIGLQLIVIDNDGKIKHLYPSACRLTCQFFGR